MNEEGDSVGLRTLLPGVQFLNDSCEYALLVWRLRFLWIKAREDWRVEFVQQDDLWQVGIGPVVIVYIRSDDY